MAYLLTRSGSIDPGVPSRQRINVIVSDEWRSGGRSRERGLTERTPLPSFLAFDLPRRNWAAALHGIGPTHSVACSRTTTTTTTTHRSCYSRSVHPLYYCLQTDDGRYDAYTAVRVLNTEQLLFVARNIHLVSEILPRGIIRRIVGAVSFTITNIMRL